MSQKKPAWIFGALVLVLILVRVLSAQVKMVNQLQYPPLPKFDIPQPARVVLENGLVVILIEDHELPIIDVSARIHTGSRLEPAKKIGLASLTGSVMRTGGTRNMSGDKLDDYLEGKAARIETSIGKELGSVEMGCLKADFEEVLEVFAQVLRYPVFDKEKLRIAKNQVFASIARQNDNPRRILFREFGKLIYGKDSPYARTEIYATINAIQREDLEAWHAQYFHPNRIILGLVGDFDTPEVVNRIRRIFGDWPKGSPPQKVKITYQQEVEPAVYYVEKSDMTQSNIIMGHLGIVRSNPDYYAVEVMNQVLSGSFASRLFSNVRSQKGLAYAVRGRVRAGWDHQETFQMWMTTKTETTGLGIEALLEEAHNLTRVPPTVEEVRKAKASILNSFIFNSDSTRKILNQQLTYEYYGYPLDWLSLYRIGIENVTVEEVCQAAADYVHPQRFTLLVVGPSEGRDKPLTEYGTVIRLDITIPEPEAAKVD